VDVNAQVAGFLRDLSLAQTSQQKMWGYKRASSSIMRLEKSLNDLRDASGALTKIPGIGPASTRVIREVLDTGESPTVERAIDERGNRSEIERRRALRLHFLSRAEVLRVLTDESLAGPRLSDYRGDFQMHSEWSDGVTTLEEIAEACEARGYACAAVTDHSHGLKIAGGMTMEEAADQRRAIASINARSRGFRLLQGIEANIALDGRLDLSDDEASQFEIVLAAPHSILRKAHDQTARMLAAVRNPRVRILAHPRGRMSGSRAGVIAQWPAVFAEAAALGVAVEIDGDPSRQDLDHTLAADALNAGCIFALDSDAHSTGQLTYAETAIAHARLAGIPPDRIINCWPAEQLVAWLADRRVIHPQE
jgi:putative hydrolase